jgi:dTDP-4-dehydrorhamnose reductase
MSRILITGDRGFFGTRFHSVYDHRHDVLGIDAADVDIVDAQAVRETVVGFRPELVIHAAAITNTNFSNANPDLTRRINVDGAVNVGEAAQSVGARMIFFSTEQVFNGNTGPGPFAESDEPRPNTMYGETKLEAEAKLREVVEHLWVLRMSWLFGLPERNMPVNPNILWNTIQIALGGVRTPVPTNEYRGHTYGYDMIARMLDIQDLPCDTYHVGSRNDAGRYDNTCHILRELGLGARIDQLVEQDTDKYKDRPRDVRLDTSVIANLGISFEESTEALSRALSEFGLRGALG